MGYFHHHHCWLKWYNSVTNDETESNNCQIIPNLLNNSQKCKVRLWKKETQTNNCNIPPNWLILMGMISKNPLLLHDRGHNLSITTIRALTLYFNYIWGGQMEQGRKTDVSTKPFLLHLVFCLCKNNHESSWRSSVCPFSLGLWKIEDICQHYAQTSSS